MRKDIKILHVCTRDFGGAGRAAFRLHLGLKSIDISSKMLVGYSDVSDNDVVRFVHHTNIFKRSLKKLRKKLIAPELNYYKRTYHAKDMETFIDDWSIYDIGRHPLIKKTDIIHLHWISEMVNYTEFFPNVRNKLIVWTLHDMNPFTGGCHYAKDCIKYVTGCGGCPQLGSENPNDLSRKIFKRKEKVYRGHNIRIITPSSWLADCARKSKLFKNFRIEVIPNSLPTSLFTRYDKQYSRNLLNLPEDKTLILFGANYKTERKGLKYLIQALKLLKGVDTSNIALVIFGDCIDNHLQDIGFSVYLLRDMQDEQSLSYVYSAADMSVVPSLEDNLPNTVLESFACRTPVIGFASGGIPEMIKDQETGLLAEQKDIKDLARKIEWMVNHPRRREKMGESARRLVEQEFALPVQARRYQKVYDAMLKTDQEKPWQK